MVSTTGESQGSGEKGDMYASINGCTEALGGTGQQYVSDETRWLSDSESLNASETIHYTWLSMRHGTTSGCWKDTMPYSVN